MGIKGRATINPYRIAAATFADRIKWDINPESHKSRDRLSKLRDSHKGERAVIMCNGPSLLKTDFSLLKDVYVFGLNKINLLFDKTDYRPDSIVCVNTLVLDQNSNFFNATKIPLFLDATGLTYVKPRAGISFLKSANIVRFAEDVSFSVYQGYTVTFVALQLAFHMGFSNVTLVGCDHNFSAKGPANTTVKAGEHDDSHFDPNYFSSVNWQLPDLIQSEISYLMALDTYQMHERRLTNSTVGGKLELLPRVSLQDFLNGK